MAVGQGALISGLSYLAIGRETVLGTYTTCTAAQDFLSASMKTTKERKTLEQISTSRTHSQGMSLGKKIEGEIESYFYPGLPASNYVLQQAMGGAITSATATGDTAGAVSFEHTIVIGDMNLSYTSLCINLRKGDSLGGKIFQYSGVRVNELSFSAELDEAVKYSASLVAIDSTQTTNDVASALTVTAFNPMSFVAGRVSVEGTFASLTSTSFWHVQGVEFMIANSLKADNDSRRIGSDLLQVLPAGIASFDLKLKMRFDTTTAFAAMLAATQFSVELEFLGPTLSGSVLREMLKFQMPKVFIMDAGDPEIGGPDEILSSEVTFQVLRDVTSATGYALRAIVRNATASYV